MAVSTSKIFGCPVCGFRVSHDAGACPRCGSKFNSSTRFECPFCGELIDPRGGSCSSCHVDFKDFGDRTKDKGSEDSIDSLLSDIIMLESSEVKKEDRRLSCPNCSWLLQGNEKTCPKCGTNLEEDVSFQCPVCAELVVLTATECPACGAVFLEEPPPEEPQPVEVQSPEPEINGVPEEKVKAVVSQEEPKKLKMRKLRTKAKQPANTKPKV